MHEVHSDMQDTGIVGLPVQGSNPADVQQAFQISEAPSYEYGRMVTNPEKVAVISSERQGGLSPESLKALAQVERNRGILESVPLSGTAPQVESVNGAGMPMRPQLEENAAVPRELIDIALRAESAQMMAAPNPAAKTHPAASGYMDPTGTKVLTSPLEQGETGQALAALAPASAGAEDPFQYTSQQLALGEGGPEGPRYALPADVAVGLAEVDPGSAEQIVGSGEGVVQYPDDGGAVPVNGNGVPLPNPRLGLPSWVVWGSALVLGIGGFALLTR
jgi:hypothetical protein